MTSTNHLQREEDIWTRPSSHDIQSAWTDLFSDPLLSTSKLKAAALSKGGIGEEGLDGGVILRSVYWRIYHGLLPPPTSLDLFPPHLEASRKAYQTLRQRYLIAPDGRWAADCSGSGSSTEEVTLCTTTPNGGDGGGGWDPLSLEGTSPWKTWFSHLELRATIRQDVERTFPDMGYFTLDRVRVGMVTALFLFAVLNPDVGYRQGMHELLAVCYLVVDRDSLDVSASTSKRDPMNDARRATLDRRYIEQNAFGLFASIMKSGKAFYEWRAEEGPRSKTAPTAQAPVIKRCNHIHHEIIRKIDPQLWERLETEGVEAQIWAIRWLRLIFTRELPFPISLRIWDGIFAEDPGLGILDFICVAMLLLIRNELLEADYPTLLTNLLHYPAPSLTYPFSSSLILSQALFLRNSVSPASGVAVVIQNQEVLGVRAQPPERIDEPGPSRGRGGVRRGGGGGHRGGMAKPVVQGLAAGLFERAQAAGLDRAIMSTVADLRKNLPDSATAYSYLNNLPFSHLSPPPRDSSTYSSIPASTSTSTSAYPRSTYLTSPPLTTHPVNHSTALERSGSSQSLKDAELQLAELRLAMLGMGKAMGEWISILRLSDEDETPDRATAWKGMERVRDTLLDAAGSEVDDIVKEWGWHDGLEAPRSRGNTPTPTPDPPTPVKDSIPLSPQVHHSISSSTEVTPTPPSVSVLPATPTFPTYPTSPPASSEASGSRPTWNMPQRDDRPITNLPRVPVAPQKPNKHIATMQAEFRSPAIQSPLESDSDDTGYSGNADPLAGLGVGIGKRDEKRSGGGGSKRGGGSVDPLLGVGVR